MYKNLLYILLGVILSFSVCFVRVELADTGEKVNLLAPTADYNSKEEKEECEGLFGDPTDEESFAYMMQMAFNIMKYAGPILCILFSGLDFLKAVVSDKKDELGRVIKRCLTRVFLALVLFFIPILINFLFPLIGWYGTCGIQ